MYWNQHKPAPDRDSRSVSRTSVGNPDDGRRAGAIIWRFLPVVTTRSFRAFTWIRSELCSTKVVFWILRIASATPHWTPRSKKMFGKILLQGEVPHNFFSMNFDLITYFNCFRYGRAQHLHHITGTKKSVRHKWRELTSIGRIVSPIQEWMSEAMLISLKNKVTVMDTMIKTQMAA